MAEGLTAIKLVQVVANKYLKYTYRHSPPPLCPHWNYGTDTRNSFEPPRLLAFMWRWVQPTVVLLVVQQRDVDDASDLKSW